MEAKSLVLVDVRHFPVDFSFIVPPTLASVLPPVRRNQSATSRPHKTKLQGWKGLRVLQAGTVSLHWLDLESPGRHTSG